MEFLANSRKCWINSFLVTFSHLWKSSKRWGIRNGYGKSICSWKQGLINPRTNQIYSNVWEVKLTLKVDNLWRHYQLKFARNSCEVTLSPLLGNRLSWFLACFLVYQLPHANIMAHVVSKEFYLLGAILNINNTVQHSWDVAEFLGALDRILSQVVKCRL